MSGLTLILKYLSKGIVPMLVDLREELSCTWIGTEIKVFLGVGHLLHALGKQIYYPLSQGRIHEFTRGKAIQNCISLFNAISKIRCSNLSSYFFFIFYYFYFLLNKSRRKNVIKKILIWFSIFTNVSLIFHDQCCIFSLLCFIFRPMQKWCYIQRE